MKAILLLILFIPITVFSQSKFLTGTGSTAILTKNNVRNSYTVIAIHDSSDSATDSVKIYVEIKDSSYQIGATDMLTQETVETLIPGDGITKLYLVYYPYASSNLYIERTNVSGTTRRTYAVIGGL